MNKTKEYLQDIKTIISHQCDNGDILWTTTDKKLLKGSPFTALESPLYLLDLGMDIHDPILVDAATLMFSAYKDDGRFKIAPGGGIYPCHVALCLKTLCYLGHEKDERLRKTLEYFLTTQEDDGGWKCNKYSFGRGEETNYSTPYTTLLVLDCLRFFDFPQKEEVTNNAIEFLLQHWTIKKPISPCHYGIGTLFKKIEYPFRGYNIFYYLYVLSFYKKVTGDKRFLEALQLLESKVTNDTIVIERVVPKLSKLDAFRKGFVSELASEKYLTIKKNILKSNQ